MKHNEFVAHMRLLDNNFSSGVLRDLRDMLGISDKMRMASDDGQVFDLLVQNDICFTQQGKLSNLMSRCEAVKMGLDEIMKENEKDIDTVEIRYDEE